MFPMYLPFVSFVSANDQSTYMMYSFSNYFVKFLKEKMVEDKNFHLAEKKIKLHNFAVMDIIIIFVMELYFI